MSESQPTTAAPIQGLDEQIERARNDLERVRQMQARLSRRELFYRIPPLVWGILVGCVVLVVLFYATRLQGDMIVQPGGAAAFRMPRAESTACLDDAGEPRSFDPGQVLACNPAEDVRMCRSAVEVLDDADVPEGGKNYHIWVQEKRTTCWVKWDSIHFLDGDLRLSDPHSANVRTEAEEMVRRRVENRKELEAENDVERARRMAELGQWTEVVEFVRPLIANDDHLRQRQLERFLERAEQTISAEEMRATIAKQAKTVREALPKLEGLDRMYIPDKFAEIARLDVPDEVKEEHLAALTRAYVELYTWDIRGYVSLVLRGQPKYAMRTEGTESAERREEIKDFGKQFRGCDFDILEPEPAEISEPTMPERVAVKLHIRCEGLPWGTARLAFRWDADEKSYVPTSPLTRDVLQENSDGDQ